MKTGLINKAVFLDRDGVINVEKEYLYRVEDFEFVPGAPEAIALLKDAGFLVIVVTNQSGVGRGYYSLEDVHRLHRHMDEELAAAGTGVDAYYVCPHHPEHGIGDFRVTCICRKPLPGMLEAAAADFAIDLARSYMIGDHGSDVAAGRAAGCRSFLVLTGHGNRHENILPKDIPVFPDILAAAEAVIDEQTTGKGSIP